MLPGTDDEIFVFGSNLAGIHGAGSALYAKKHYGALQGVGSGRMGLSYAIPTKNRALLTLPLSDIALHVKEFIKYAAAHTETQFHVVAIGCGLAGYSPKDIAPLFRGVSTNVNLPTEFRPYVYGTDGS
jgi:hypothetical protein